MDDPEFHAVVDTMRGLAMNVGFTPYEMKQALFMAIYMNEMRSCRAMVVPLSLDTRELLELEEKKRGRRG